LAGKSGCAGSSISGDFSSNLDVNLSYSDWLEALFIALKYRLVIIQLYINYIIQNEKEK